ncbi:MAG TPA: response regulator [Polyangiaceae bacterium]|nr:response regulator [Polyangiaceae bacterium]
MQLDGANGERRLLLVEDDGELRGFLAELLRGDGYDVVGASNGSEALEYLKRAPAPDLILLDLMMPVKDGWQFRIEQRRDPSISSIPVLAISADDTPKAAAIDAEGYIKKPFHYPELLESIKHVIDTRRLAHLDRMASLGTLAAGIAHEINNPLTYIIANLQLVEEQIPRIVHDYSAALQKSGAAHTPELQGGAPGSRFGEVSARLHDALEGAERIRGIVLHVKTFSRAGDEHRTLVDVRSILDSAIKVVFSEIKQRARLVKEYGHIPLVLANPGQLGQVFLNLLLNAAHAIEHEEPEENTIRVATKTLPSGEISIEVADTGRGIPREMQPRIFDPFFTTKPLGLGTGLGLSICHGIVRSLNGTITVQSELGKGTTFSIKLPPSPERAISPSPPAAQAPVSADKGKILIIDDEPRLAQALRDMIGKHHDTSVVTKGPEALTLLMQEPDDARFDLILCDLHMPDVSGMDLHQQLAATRPVMADRMVFMTGGAFSERSREFVRSVKNTCIDKPIDIKQLRSLVASTIARLKA